MPYNNTPIAPSKDVTGHVSLPLARVQKIIQADPERLTVTKNASFAIALATEMMIQHLAVTTHNVVKTERKPRRNIQYRDVSSAVSRTDNLEFLVDVVPKTMQYGVYRKRKAAADDEQAQREREGGKASGVEGKASAGEGKKSGVEGRANVVEGKANAVEGRANTVEGKAKDKAVESANGMAQTTLPEISIQSSAARDLLARAGDGQTTTTATPDTAQNGTSLDPLARTELVPLVPETEAMDVDDERVADSEADEDPAAMQIEMEMRGPSGQQGKGKAATASVSASPAPRVSSGGFTAINSR